jgi:Autotransporter beta-domain
MATFSQCRPLIWAGLIGILLGSTPAWAMDFLIENGVTQTTPIDLLNDGDTLSVEEGGSLEVSTGDHAVGVSAIDDFIIINDGSIIYSGGNIAAISLLNSTDGFIHNEATGIIDGTNAHAIYAENSVLSILNEGTITSEVTAIFAGDSIALSIVNEGTISGAQAIESYGGSADLYNDGKITGNVVGVNFEDALVTSLINTGTITGLDPLTTTDQYGIRLYETDVSYFSNQGTITGGTDGIHQHGSSLTGNNAGSITGGFVGYNVHQNSILDLVNSGTIQGTSEYGIYIYDDTVGLDSEATIDNEGEISGGISGVLVYNAKLDLVNSGTIVGGESGLKASTGAVVYEPSILNLFNSGTIQGTAGNGIGINDTEADIINDGAIYGATNGISVDNSKLNLINAGLISGTNRSLNFDSTDVTVTLLPGSVLIGDIYLGGADTSFIFGNGLNALLTFDPSSNLPANIDTNGMPYVVDAANYRIAVVDTTGFAMADEMLEDLTGSVMGAVSKRLYAPASGGSSSVALSAGETITPAGSDISPRKQFWGEVLGGWRAQDASSPAWSSSHRLAGIVAGLDGTLSDTYRAGLFAGAAQGRLDVDDNAQEIDSRSIFGGAYVSRSDEQIIADLTILAGWQENDSERLVANNAVAGGLETAEAFYDGFFIAPELTVGKRLPVITPTFTLRYAGLFLEGYEEQGSTAALAVDSRAVHNLNSRAQLALPLLYELSDGSSVSLENRVGFEGRLTFGGDVSASLLANTVTFDPDGDDTVASLYAGTDLAFRSADSGFALRLGVEASAGSDGSFILSSRLGGEIAF